MDDVVSTFPLLRLPKKAVRNTLKIMKLIEIFGISILSKRAKNLVESLKITTEAFVVEVSARFEVSLYFVNCLPLQFKLYQVRENKPLQEIGTPESIYIENDRTTWRNSMSVEQMLDHLKFISHSSKTELSFYERCERFSAESIHKVIKKVGKINIYSNNRENNRKVLSLIQAASLDIGCFVNQCIIPRSVLIQNLEFIYAPLMQITMNELLIMNARGIHVSCRRLRVKVFNQFLKLWTNGSNPRLECASLQFRGNSDNLLRGFKYEEAPRDRERIFKYSDDREPEKVIGGWDVWRSDGTQATITVEQIGILVDLNMYVWHDHCVVN